MRLYFRLALFFAVLPTAISVSADEAPVRHRVLLLGQKPDSHPATTHEYMAGVRLMGLLLERSPGVQAVVVQADSPWEAGPELLDGADAAIVFLSEGAKWVTEAPNRLAAFQRLAKRGGGLTCLHWGMGTRESKPIVDYVSLFGACHGGVDRKYKFATFTVKPMETHPVTNGLHPFEVRDEFYYALKQPTPDLNLKVAPLLRVSIDGTDQTIAWACERPDRGRSFGFSGLHYHDNWKLPEYRRLVLQGVLWTLKQEIPKAGISVDVRPEDLGLPNQ